MDRPTLYSYFRSSCSWRVRIALAYKGIEYETKTLSLLKKEQLSDEYLKINPMGQVPTFVHHGIILTQSIAILEYIEEVYPQNPLMPKDPTTRAKVREIVEIIASGTQPIQNLSVMLKHSSDDEGKRIEWANHWITVGLTALEKILEKSSGKYCVGDELTLADCCLPPQVYNAVRFKVDMTKFPTITRVNDTLALLEPFKAAIPAVQIDCPPEFK